VSIGIDRLVDEAEGQHDGDEPDDRVDEEDPAPSEGVGHDPTDGRPDGEPDGGDTGPQADGFGLGRGIRVGRTDQRQRCHADDGGAHARDPAGGVEDVDVRSDTAGERRHREDHDAHDVGASAPVRVRQRRRRHHEHRHREAVCRDHPLETALTDVEVLLDRRERDVDDGGIEVDHEQPEPRRDQDRHWPSGRRCSPRVGHQ
jgi:hypothetical protein